MTIYGYVYLWHDKKTNMFCVGSHYITGRTYITSTGWMKKAYAKRPQDFKKRIIFKLLEPCKKTLLKEEQRYLDMIKDEELSTSKNVINGTNRYYNMKKHASGGNGSANLGKKRSVPSHNKGKPMSEEQKHKLRLAMTGRIRSEEHIQNLKNSHKINKGRKWDNPSPLKGKTRKPFTEQHIANMKLAQSKRQERLKDSSSVAT